MYLYKYVKYEIFTGVCYSASLNLCTFLWTDFQSH